MLGAEQHPEIDVGVGVEKIGGVAQPAVYGSWVRDEPHARSTEEALRIVEQTFESGAHADMLAGTRIPVATDLQRHRRRCAGRALRVSTMQDDAKSAGAQATDTRLHHVALRARDVDVTIAFYQRMFGLEIVRDQRPRSVWLGLDDGSVLMIEARAADEPAVSAGSRELFALRTTSDRKAEIKQAALTTECFDGETEHTVYLRDPDGRRVGASTYPLAT